MSHPEYVQDMIRNASTDALRERLIDLRVVATDCLSLAVLGGDRKTVRRLDDIFVALNEIEEGR